MELRILKTSYERAWGAMFRRTLRDMLLVFLYPHASRRFFHTFFCPPMRLTAVNEAGTACFNQIIPPGRFVRLPACNIVIESHPEAEVPLQEVMKSCDLVGRPSAGSIETFDTERRIVYQLILVNLKKIACLYDRLGKKVDRWADAVKWLEIYELSEYFEAAQQLDSLIDMVEFRLPSAAAKLTYGLLDVESTQHAELTALQQGAYVDWRKSMKTSCFRCKCAVSAWRKVFLPPEHLAKEYVWRYDRPENAVPVCRRCAYELGWNENEDLRLRAAFGIWGVRFVPFHRLHLEVNSQSGEFVGWNKYKYPLWPKEFGGSDWETGCGCVECAVPRLPEDCLLTAEHRALLQSTLPRSYKRRRNPA